MSFAFSKTSLANMEGVNKDLIMVFRVAIKDSPIDFGVPSTGGLRTADEQNLLFRNQKSKCDGYEKLSNHQSGNALDFYAYVDGKASWEKHHLAMVAGAILSTAKRLGVDLKWGGTFGSSKFNGWDMPHFELV